MPMPMWLDVVNEDLNKLIIDGLPEPITEIGEEDYLVGEANTDQRKLFHLASQYDRIATMSLLEARYVSEEERESLTKKATEFYKKSELILEIFWVSVKDSFNLWGEPSVGIRKGWKIVRSESEDFESSIKNLLCKILGK